jgi:hypothetical protein
MTENSTQFTQVGDTNLYCSTAPSTGGIWSIWDKAAKDLSNPDAHNDANFTIKASNWTVFCISGNISYTDPINVNYNANTMIGVTGPSGPTDVYVGDFSTYFSNAGSWNYTECLDWVWIAWQVIPSGTGITINQWLKFSPTGAVFPAGTTTITFTTMRATYRQALIDNYSYTAGAATTLANSWTPATTLSSFLIGDGNGNYAHGANMYHARVDSTITAPSLSYLNSISTLYTADSTAWADYSLVFTSDVALTDRSGNGRNLTKGTGTFLAGAVAPITSANITLHAKSITWNTSTNVTITYDWSDANQLLDWTVNRYSGTGSVNTSTGKLTIPYDSNDLCCIFWKLPIAASTVVASIDMSAAPYSNQAQIATNIQRGWWDQGGMNTNPVIGASVASANSPQVDYFVNGADTVDGSSPSPLNAANTYTLTVSTTHITIKCSVDNVVHTYTGSLVPLTNGQLALGATGSHDVIIGAISITGEIDPLYLAQAALASNSAPFMLNQINFISFGNNF